MIALVLSASILVEPSKHPELLAEAETAYRAGLDARDDTAKARTHFIRSAEAYERLWENGHGNAAIARGMAQARLLAGDLGRAIRDYRRGLRVAPHDADLRRGLDAARGRVVFPHSGDLAESARARDADTRLDRIGIPFATMLLVVLAVSAIGWLTMARAWVTSRGGLAVSGGVLVLIAAAFGVWLGWENSRLRAHWSAPAAVVVAPVELRTGNSTEYTLRVEGRLPAGVEFRVLGERGGWLHVELADGAAGWVPESRVVLVD
jgi:hypothetical protein